MKTNEKMSALGFSVVDCGELLNVEGGVTSSEWAAMRPFYKLAAIVNPWALPSFWVGDAIYP
jgi:hypothetical protein